MDAKQFGNWLFELRDTHISRPEMARIYPWHVNTIKSYEKEGRLPDVDYLAALAFETGHDFTDLIARRLEVGSLAKENQDVIDQLVMMLTVKADSSDTESLCYATAHCSEPGHAVMEEAATYNPLKKGSCVLDDDSMEPTLHRGSVLQYDKKDTHLVDGKIFVLLVNDKPQVRRVQFGFDGELLLVADNKKFETLRLTPSQAERLKVLGRVTMTLTPTD